MSSITEPFISENGPALPINAMEGEYRSGLIIHVTKDIGEMTKQMARASLNTLMAIFMKESGRMTRLMGMVCTCTKMELATKGNGLMISSMDEVSGYYSLNRCVNMARRSKI